MRLTDCVERLETLSGPATVADRAGLGQVGLRQSCPHFGFGVLRAAEMFGRVGFGTLCAVQIDQSFIPLLPQDQAGDRTTDQDDPQQDVDGAQQGCDQRPPTAPPPAPFKPSHRPGLDRLAVEEPLQFVGQFAGRTAAPRRGLLQAFKRERFQVPRDVRVQRAGWHWLTLQDLLQGLRQTGGLERWAPGKGIVQHGSQGIDIGGWPHQIEPGCRLFGRHEIGGPQHFARGRKVAVELHAFRETEVGHPGVAGTVEQDVAGLQIPMDHAVVVGVLNRLGDVPHQRRRVARRHWSAGQVRRQALAFDVAHREEVPALERTHLVDRHNAGMIQPGHRLGFSAKALHRLARRQLSGQDHLHGDDAVQAALTRPVDHAHPAAADLFQQLVVAEDPGAFVPSVERHRARRIDHQCIVIRGVHPITAPSLSEGLLKRMQPRFLRRLNVSRNAGPAIGPSL